MDLRANYGLALAQVVGDFGGRLELVGVRLRFVRFLHQGLDHGGVLRVVEFFLFDPSLLEDRFEAAVELVGIDRGEGVLLERSLARGFHRGSHEGCLVVFGKKLG